MSTTTAGVSDIQEFFQGSTVFLTGATGYIGKLVLEKLLRGCPGIRHIYILIRVKKGKDTSVRFMEIFQCPIYDELKRKYPKFTEKITIMCGDCAQPQLGLSDQDVDIILNEVNCIIHCAATVRFDQKLSQAAKINLRGTKDLLHIASDMKDLKAFVHVSTAYSNCDKSEIDEIVYPPKLEGEKLLAAIDALSDDFLLDLQPRLLEKLPNTYTLTKQIAEDYIKRHGQHLPICIVRPSIVTPTVEEPLRGFLDSYYGPTGIFLACAIGLMRSCVVDKNMRADFVPGDYVVNCILSAAHYISKKRIYRDPCDPEVFNFVSGPENPIRWSEFITKMVKEGTAYSSPKILWYPFAVVQSNRYIHAFFWFTLHTIPANIIDGIAVMIGKKPGLVEIYAKIWKMNDVISYFPTRQWTFTNTNTRKLLAQMSPSDKSLFNFNIKTLDWDDYVIHYLKGMRVYLIKDPMETIPEGMKHMRKLKIIHYSTCIVLALLVLFFFRLISRIAF